MAIKFFFLPVVQNITQLIEDLKYGGATAEEISILAEQIASATPLVLPVNPETLELTTQSDITTTEVVKLGEVAIPKGAKLSSLTIESFFPYKQDNNIFDVASKVANAVGSLLPAGVTTGLNIFSSFTADKYYRYFQQLQRVGAPVRLVISECGVNMDVIVESIEKKYITCDKDMWYTLQLREWRDPTPTSLGMKLISGLITGITTTAVDMIGSGGTTKVASPAPPRQKKGLAVGDTVIVNGTYCYDSFGSKPYGTFKEFRGKISHMASNSKATHKYHITTPDGGWRGWVKAEQIRGVE